MSEPRRSTRARAREDAAPAAPDTPNDKPAKAAKAALKRKRTSLAVKDAPPSTPVAEGAPLPPRQTLPVQLVDGGLLSVPQGTLPMGSLRRITPGGSKHAQVGPSLPAPYGVALHGRSAYVTTCSVCAGTGGVTAIPIG